MSRDTDTMIHAFRKVLMLAFFAPCFLNAQQGKQPDFPAIVKASDLHYNTPVTRSEDGMPTGNGRMGTLVWTIPSALKFQLNRADVFGNNSSSRNFFERHTDYCGGTGARKPATVTLYTNAAYLVPAKLIYKDAAQVLLTGGSGVILQKLVKKGMNPAKAMALVQPIVVSTYSLYNPDYNYREYLVPGLITVAIQMMIIMAAVLMLNYERTTGSMEELVVLAKGSASGIIMGKTLAHLTVSWINWVLVAWVIFPAFSIGHGMAGWNFFIIYSLMALACIGLGAMVSAISQDTMLATDIGLFYTSPAFVFSGYTFPKWGMPWYDQFYAHLLPYSWFLDGFIKVFTMGLPLSYAMPEISALLLFSAISYPVAILVLQRQCNKILGV